MCITRCQRGIFRRLARPRRGPLGMRQASIFKLRHYRLVTRVEHAPTSTYRSSSEVGRSTARYQRHFNTSGSGLIASGQRPRRGCFVFVPGTG